MVNSKWSNRVLIVDETRPGLNPFRGLPIPLLSPPVFTGGYSQSSPSGLAHQIFIFFPFFPASGKRNRTRKGVTQQTETDAVSLYQKTLY